MSRYGERTRISEAVSGFGQPAGVAGSSFPTIYTFTTTTTFTVPAGVTYLIANITGGGGGTFIGASAATNGGDSSVAFAAGTITAKGGTAMGSTNTTFTGTDSNQAAGVRFGEGAGSLTTGGGGSASIAHAFAHNGATIRAGGAVTPAASLTVTVGAGGSAGTNGSAGKSGFVSLEAYDANDRRCDLFLAGGTFTPPAGVTTVIASITAGGGSVGQGDWTGVVGGNSSVAFSGGTQTATGGYGMNSGRFGFEQYQAYPIPVNNSGGGGRLAWAGTTTRVATNVKAGDGQIFVTEQTVTPLSGITVTVGAGGAGSGGANGGSGGGTGVVWIEYAV